MNHQENLQIILSSYNAWETNDAKAEYVDKLEGLITTYNEAANRGEELVPDSIYDTCIDYLRELKPSSPLLHQVWSEDGEALDEDLDQFLASNPMMSIQTIKSMFDQPLEVFKSKIPRYTIQFIAAIKLNGWGTRIVLRNGHLVKGTSRGRSTNGRDLTEQMKYILGTDYFEEYENYPLVEIRGEVLLPFHNLDEARQFNPDIKSAFTGVSSMLRDSASPEENSLLDFVAYNIFADGLEFETVSDKYNFLQDTGFIIPEHFTVQANRDNIMEVIERVLTEMDIRTTDYEYYTDGTVLSVDEVDIFETFGAEDKFFLGNVALKMGKWAQDGYSGIISHIEWSKGKSKKTPVAILEPPVLTATGNHVTNVPLYAPAYILMLEAYPGNRIHFRYGGEAGVVPTTHDGRLVTDKTNI